MSIREPIYHIKDTHRLLTKTINLSLYFLIRRKKPYEMYFFEQVSRFNALVSRLNVILVNAAFESDSFFTRISEMVTRIQFYRENS